MSQEEKSCSVCGHSVYAHADGIGCGGDAGTCRCPLDGVVAAIKGRDLTQEEERAMYRSANTRSTRHRIPTVIIDGVPQHEPEPDTMVPCPRQGLTHCEECGNPMPGPHRDVVKPVRDAWRAAHGYPQSSVPADRFEKDKP